MRTRTFCFSLAATSGHSVSILKVSFRPQWERIDCTVGNAGKARARSRASFAQAAFPFTELLILAGRARYSLRWML